MTITSIHANGSIRPSPRDRPIFFIDPDEIFEEIEQKPRPKVIKSRGWKIIKRNLRRIREYGRATGILEAPTLNTVVNEELRLQKEEANKNENDLNLEVNEISMMHSAIPFLPLPAAAVCCCLNIIFPGTGTITCGLLLICCGLPRIEYRGNKVVMSIIVNFMVGISQCCTITFFLVGWVWSGVWGGKMIMLAVEYDKAVRDRRRAAVAVQALELLAGDGLMRRSGLKAFVKGAATATSQKFAGMQGNLRGLTDKTGLARNTLAAEFDTEYTSL